MNLSQIDANDTCLCAKHICRKVIYRQRCSRLAIIYIHTHKQIADRLVYGMHVNNTSVLSNLRQQMQVQQYVAQPMKLNINDRNKKEEEGSLEEEEEEESHKVTSSTKHE